MSHSTLTDTPAVRRAPASGSLLQEGDLLHLVMREPNASGVYDALKKGPEAD